MAKEGVMGRHRRFHIFGMLVAGLLAGTAAPAAFAAAAKPGKEAMREKCRAQVRALAVRGAAVAGAEERRRQALFRQCMEKGGTL
jgi:hypothetical protein